MKTVHFILIPISDKPDPRYLEDFSATLTIDKPVNRHIVVPEDIDPFILELQELKKKFQRKKENWDKQQRQEYSSLP